MDIKNPIVKDILDDRLEFVEYTIVEESPKGSEWDFENKNGTLTFVYKRNGVEDVTINKVYTINITTRIKDEYKDLYGANKTDTEFINKASIKGDNLSEKEDTANQKYKSTVIKKTNEGYDYTTRVAKWKIVVNQNKMEINNAIVTDIIGDNHEFVPGTLKLDDVGIPKFSDEQNPNKPYYIQDGKTLTIYSLRQRTLQ